MEHSSFSTLFFHWLFSAAAVLITAQIVPGFRVEGFASALAAAVVIGLANLLIWPVLFVLTLPFNILTFGLFTFVVNGAVLKIAAAFISGFAIEGWWAAIFGAIILTIVRTALHYLL
jgi:putative membrane protein